MLLGYPTTLHAHRYDSTDDEYSAEEGKAKRAKLQIKNDEELARKL